MGLGRDDREKMIYTIYSKPMTEKEFYDVYKHELANKYDWSREPDDYKELFESDPKYNELYTANKKTRKELKEYKEIKRTLKQLNK